MSFSALLDDLELLKKSLDEDDAKIAAAAAEGDDEDDKHDEPDGDEDGPDLDGDGDGEPMGKSFEFELESGEKVEAFDATPLLKSLQDEVKTLRAGKADAEKVIEQTVTLLKSMQAQVSALNAKVAELGSQGRGRKAVLNVHEKPDTLTKSLGGDGDKPSRDSVLQKCLSAQSAGALTAIDVSRAETALNMGMPLPADIATRLQ